MAARRRAANTTERRIHFYRANAGNDDAGRPRSYDASPHLAELSRQPFTEAGRYQPVEDNHYLCAWPAGGQRPRMTIFRAVRRAGLPQVERAGELEDLNIPAAAGIAEAIHVVFFDHNIVGADFNFYGPRMSRLGPYLELKTSSDEVDFEPLLRQDIIAQVRRLTDVRLVRLRVNPAGAAIAREADRSLFDALNAGLRAGQAEEAEIVLRMAPHSRRALGGNILRAVKQLVRVPQLRESTSAFSVKGFDPEHGRVEDIDVLRDHFVVAKQVVRMTPRGRAVVATSAFQAIQEAYQELGPALRDAASVAARQA